MSKLCTSCNEVKPVAEYWKDSSRKDGLQNYCKSCSYKKLNMKAAAARQRAYEKRNPIKQEARLLIRKALASGTIVKQPCFLCDVADTVAHHLNYDYPYKVIWLCSKHHYEVHHER